METDYIPYLGWGLNTIEDIVDAFTKYKKGGWWVRKIIYKDAFHREIVLGPYTEEEAKKDAREWNENHLSKKFSNAKAYSFVELICQNTNDYDCLKDFLFEEYIWKPPKGSEVFCLIYTGKKVLMLKKSKALNKIKTYIGSREEVPRDITSQKEVPALEEVSRDKEIDFLEAGDYEIFYKRKDILANLQAKKLKKLTQDYRDYPEEMWNIYNYAVKKEDKKPVIIPGYIEDFDEVPRTFNLNYFKNLKNYSKKDAIAKIKNDTKRIGIEKYSLPFVYDKNDTDLKNLTLFFRKGKSVFSLKNEDNYIELEGNFLKYNFDMIDKKIFSLFIELAKVLKLEVLKTKDIIKSYCDDYPLYLNIIRFLAGKESIFEDLGFIEENIEKRREIISEYKERTLQSFREDEEEDLFSQKNLKEIAIEYLENDLKDKYYCQILNKVSVEIYNKYKNCIFEYSLNLKTN